MTVPHWPATKGLSVYNTLVVKKTNEMAKTHVLATLQAEHLPRYDADDVVEGIAFLVEKGLITEDLDTIRAVHVAGPNRPVKLKRANEDADLELDL